MISMKAEMSASDAIKESMEEWQADLAKYILPSTEFFVFVMIFSTLTSLITLPIYFFILTPTFFADSMSDAALIGMFAIYMAVYLFTTGLSLLFRSILDGGMAKVVRGIERGEKYTFFDIIKNGWKWKWNHILIEFSTALINVGFILGIVILSSVILIPIIILSFTAPLIGLLLSLIYLVLLLVVLIALSVILSPLLFIAFTIHTKEGSRGLKPVMKALSFMWQNKMDTITMGGTFFLIALIGSAVPMIGLLVASAGNIFMYQIVYKVIGEQKEPKGRAKPFMMR